MIRYSYGNLPKSSLMIVGLLFSLLGVASPSDTLIVDGKIVQVEREVKYSSPQENPVEDLEPEKQKKDRQVWDFRVGLNPSLAMGTIQSSVDDFATIETFSKSEKSLAIAFAGAHAFAISKKDKWHREVGFSTDYWTKTVTSFDPSQIRDNFIEFQIPEAGQIDQIYYSVFSPPFFETDTTALVFQDVKSTHLQLALNAGLTYVTNEKEDVAFYGSAHLGLVWLRSSLENNVALMPTGQDSTFLIVVAEPDQRVTGGLSIGTGVILRKKRQDVWRLGAQFKLNLSAQPVNAPLTYRPWRAGLSLSRFF